MQIHLTFDEDGDIRIDLPSGENMRFDSTNNNPGGVSFVRFYDADGNEVVGWDCAEWEESPQEVMGAILGKLCETLEAKKGRENDTEQR